MSGDAKKVLRAELLKKRAAIDPEIREKWNAALSERLFALPRFQEAQRVMAYCSMPKEAATGAILRETLRQGKRLFLPRCVPGHKRFEAVEVPQLEGHLAPGPWRDLMEPLPSLPPMPETVHPFDLILVPGVGFDREGHRLGFGAGMYDRFLTEHPTPFRLALAYSLQVVDTIPADCHDQPVQAILTESEWIIP